jgi:hypothetical protein
MEVDFVLERPKRRTNAVKSAYRVDITQIKARFGAGGVRLLWGSVE